MAETAQNSPRIPVGGLETEVALMAPALPGASRDATYRRSLRLAREFVAQCKDNSEVPWSYRHPIELWQFDATNRLLNNGSRLYDDHGFVEYSTAECSDPIDLLAIDRAGEHILSDLLESFRETVPEGKVSLIKNNCSSSEYSPQFSHSYSCHENYSVSPSLFREITSARPNPKQSVWIAHQVSRAAIVGAGRFGTAIPIEFGPLSQPTALAELVAANRAEFASVWTAMHRVRRHLSNIGPLLGLTSAFELSARAAFFSCLRSHDTMVFRPLINLRNEPHADPLRHRRLHVITGDSNRADLSTYLKFGCSALVLATLERSTPRQVPSPVSPLRTFRAFSSDPTLRLALPTCNGSLYHALDYQEQLCAICERALEEFPLPRWAQCVTSEWRSVLDRLRKDPLSLRNELDWVAKYGFMQDLVDKGGREDDPRLAVFNIAYHRLGQGDYFAKLVQEGRMRVLVKEELVYNARCTPPSGTRAQRRADILRTLVRPAAEINWNYLRTSDGQEIWLDDP